MCPDFNIILSDSLLRFTNLPAVANVDDIKFHADVQELTDGNFQYEIDRVFKWSEAHRMPLSMEKCAVLLWG